MSDWCCYNDTNQTSITPPRPLILTRLLGTSRPSRSSRRLRRPRLASVMREFRQVDVFTTTPYLGNPVAVVLGADGMTDGQMQQFANWTNLSETTYVLAPQARGADYWV